jgi:magnesium chelatase family protein
LPYSRHRIISSPMLFKALSAAVYGIDAHIIDVEVDYSGVWSPMTASVCLDSFWDEAVREV